MSIDEMYSIARVAYIDWRNNTLRAEMYGRGTEYEVQVQLRRPEVFAIYPELRFHLPGDAPEIDVLRTDSSYNLISSRMVKLLQDAGVKFEIFPVPGVDRKTQAPLSHEYFVFHLQEFIEAIDLARSTYEVDENYPGLDIKYITHIVFSSAFEQNPELHRPLFYDPHRQLNLFIRNDLRQRFEQQGFTGLVFFSLNEYHENLKVEDLTIKINAPRIKQTRKQKWSDPNHRELSKWLADPAEYGEPPVAIETIHQEKSPWPLFEEEGEINIAFHRYHMADGQSGIALTGPITWSFGDADLEGFSWEELKRLFAGWYIALAGTNSPEYDWDANEQERDALVQQLAASDSGFIEVMDYIHIGELMWYAYRREIDGRKEVVCTDTINPMVLQADSPYLLLPPLYYFLGLLFFEGKLS